ncbi:MAG: methyltransferase type 11 [Actinomycetota bacterium]|nr:methyltransferase type 11 [Actinomycetota bacterium]
MLHSVRTLLVDSPTSLGAQARLRRWEVFRSHFPDLGDMRVLDLGGTVESWRRAPVRPAHVTVLNLVEPGWGEDGWATPLTGDACAARAALEAAGAQASYDLVFSNSLLEHVGGHAQRSRLAESVRELAPYHWVQTPYRYFPVEPHWLFPLMQFLPMRLRAVVAERWPLAHTRPASRADAISNAQWTELIGITELRAYFPTSQILKERLFGLTKSITAVTSPA